MRVPGPTHTLVSNRANVITDLVVMGCSIMLAILASAFGIVTPAVLADIVATNHLAGAVEATVPTPAERLTDADNTAETDRGSEFVERTTESRGFASSEGCCTMQQAGAKSPATGAT